MVIASSWFALFAMPYLFSASWVRQSLAATPSETFFLLAAGSFVALLLLAYEPARTFAARYRHNAVLCPPPFTYADAIAVFVGGMIVLILLVPGHVLGLAVISFSLATWMKFLGFLFVAWACAVLWWPIRKEVGRSHEPDENEAAHFHDAPITRESEDVLGRAPFVEDLYQQIVKYPFPESFVFGLHGRWGEGKTSVMNLLHNKLIGDSRLIVVAFNPWYFSSVDAFVRGFYDEIYSTLNRSFFLPNLKRLFAQYQRVLSAGLRKVSGVEITLDPPNEPVTELKGRIQDCITRTKKRLVILVDDIDRLRDRAEVLSIFKLVKLSGNFDHAIFVLSFDQAIISTLLADHNQPNTIDQEFLDKIVQSPVHLPAVHQTDIDAFFAAGKDRLFERLQITSEQREAVNAGFELQYPLYINLLFDTLRTVKRFLNGLDTRLPAVKDEVHWGDFLVLECIRIFYPSVYHDIWRNRRIYLLDSWNPSSYAPDRQQTVKDIQEHIGRITKNVDHPDVLLGLLKLLFVKIRDASEPASRVYGASPDSYRQQQRITHPEVFPRYFTLLIPAVEVSDQAVRTMLAAWSSTSPSDREFRIMQDLTGYEKELLPQLLDRLRLFADTIPADAQESLAQALYRNVNAFRAPGDKESPLSPYFKVRALIFQIIDTSIDGDKIQAFLSQMIEETPSLDLAATVVHWSGQSDLPYSNIMQRARKVALQTDLSVRLEKDLIEHEKDIFEEEGSYAAYVLYQWGSYAREKMNGYIFRLLNRRSDYVGRVIEPFISHLGSPLGGGTLQYENLVALYNGQRLYECAKQRLKAADLLPREKFILTAFVSNYDARDRSASKAIAREANQQRFVAALNAGRDQVGKKEFQKALQHFDEALAINDWDDPNGWMGEARYEQWRCLLELAWNDGEPRSDVFEQARATAGTEAEIKSLAASASRNPYPRPSNPILEFYSCLFYCLVWKLSKNGEKTVARESFQNHYTLLTRDQSLSTNEYRERLKDLCNDIK